MRFDQLVETSRQVGATRKRTEKTERLAELLRALVDEEIEIGVAYLCGLLRQGRIGLGGATVRATRPGCAADQAQLELREVDAAFAQIGATRGAGSTNARQDQLRQLLERATAAEQDFLQRLIVGEIRQGANEGVLIEAVARASGVAAPAVRRAHMLGGELQDVATTLLREGEAGLARFRLQLFRPVQPMLAGTADSPTHALDDLATDAAFEWKLDGARIQVHKQGERICVYTRKLNEVTAAVPEVVELVRALPAESLILDGEVLALREDGRPHPFQTSMRRFGRKLDVDALRQQLPLTPFFFDCLHAAGDDLLDRPTEERAAALAEFLPSSSCVPRLVTADPTAAEEFFEEALDRGHEGVMAKSLAAPYEAGRRGKHWFKLKRAHTVDLVVLAVDWGSGRRQGTLSNLHLGARDAQSRWWEVGKTFKGMTDEILAWQTKKLQEIAIDRDQWTVHVRPELVVEIAFNDVQASPQYPGGLALRFARLKRYREDKTVDQADSFESLQALLPD